MKFLHRHKELSLLTEIADRGGLAVFMGRRRVGKTRLIKEWAAQNHSHKLLYSQAIESNPKIQLLQIWSDLKSQLSLDLAPHSWEDFFKIISLIDTKATLVIDEFPFLTQSDPSLPSRFQKWIDHSMPRGLSLCLLGSSQSLMQDIFLDAKAPLYERAHRIVRVKPLSYKYFCNQFSLDPLAKDTFTRFSMVGGIPKYWEKIDANWNLLQMAEELFFSDQAFFENEKLRLLKDENVEKSSAASVLDAIGLGACKPNDIARVLSYKQTSLSKIFRALIESGLIAREVPFGDSHRNAKKTLYTISDPFLSFYFNVFSPHRTRWDVYTEKEKEKLLNDHASKVFESYYRELFPSSSRYYESSIELDCIHYVSKDRIQVSELKYRNLGKDEKKDLETQANKQFYASKLGPKWPKNSVDFKAIGIQEGLALISKSD